MPWDYDFTNDEFDGVFLSNGPGDPAMCDKTVANITKALQIGKPIMGICLGNQLLARAAGASTYKLKFGHRSHNQPVLLAGTDRCFITSVITSYSIHYTKLYDGATTQVQHGGAFEGRRDRRPAAVEAVQDLFVDLREDVSDMGR